MNHFIKQFKNIYLFLFFFSTVSLLLKFLRRAKHV